MTVMTGASRSGFQFDAPVTSRAIGAGHVAFLHHRNLGWRPFLFRPAPLSRKYSSENLPSRFLRGPPQLEQSNGLSNLGSISVRLTRYSAAQLGHVDFKGPGIGGVCPLTAS
jgi:hypothetical protein